METRADSAHIRQSTPDAGLGFEVKVLQKKCVPSSLGSGVAAYDLRPARPFGTPQP